MLKILLCASVPVVLFVTTLAALAQTPAVPPTTTPCVAPHAAAPANGRPDPLDAQAPVPALVYRSSLSPAPRADADKPLGWREANDAVARIGGWRTYLRQAQLPEPAAGAPLVAAPAAMADTAAPPQAKPLPAPAAHSAPSGHEKP